MSSHEVRWKKVMSKRERKILAAFAEVLLAWPDGKKTSMMKDLLDGVERHVWCMTWDKRILFRMCLWIFELSAIFYYASLRTMSGMKYEKRSCFLEAWHNTWWSTKRVIKRFIEVTIFMNYYTLKENTDRIGYKPTFKPALSAPDFPRENLISRLSSSDVREEADVCVIGTGAGGAVAAKELAEKGHSVILLEEGDWFDVNEFGKDTMSSTLKLYRDGGATLTVGWPFIPTFLGRCVGGTTLINSGTCFRTPENVLRHWVEEYGLTGWGAEGLRPYFERVESTIGVATAREEVQGPSGALVRAGFEKLGYGLKPLDRNVPDCCGSGICVQGCPTNAKQATHMNYVPMAMRAGARVYTMARVKRIRYRRSHATEVWGRFVDPLTREKGSRFRVKAKVIVVACGSMLTPVLLADSHIPNPSGQRGRNLTLHPATKVYGIFDHEVRGWEGIPQGYYSDALAKEGIKFEGVFLSPAYAASTILLTGQRHREMMEQYPHVACFGFMVSDTTHGRIFRLPGGINYAWYTINKQDLPKFKKGYQLLAEALFAAGAKKVLPGICTLPEITREQGSQVIGKLNLRNKDLDLQAFHPLGSCRMGADPREAVVDAFGRVYGMDNLFVADGSIFPTSLGVNPMITIMAAASKIADNISRNIM